MYGRAPGRMDFGALFSQHAWRPIRNCPGRYALAAGAVAVSPRELVSTAQSQEFRCAAARDPVIVTALPDGGLISYKRADGSFLHTLSTAEGFARKLAQLGITLDARVSG